MPASLVARVGSCATPSRRRRRLSGEFIDVRRRHAGRRTVGRSGWGWHAFRKVGRTRIKVRNGVVNRASPAAVVVRNDQRGSQTVIYRPGKEEFSPPCPARTFSFAADKRTTHSSRWTYIPQSCPWVGLTHGSGRVGSTIAKVLKFERITLMHLKRG